MNLRISEGQLRFRITREEVNKLLGGTRVALVLPLGEYTISLTHSDTPLMLEVNAPCWTLLVDRAVFEDFTYALPTREGIEHTVTIGGASLTLTLEVDVRRK